MEVGEEVRLRGIEALSVGEGGVQDESEREEWKDLRKEVSTLASS